MINGIITEDEQAIVKITLLFKDSIIKIDAIVDTGFNGSLCIPQEIIKQSGWRDMGEEQYELATGENARIPTLLGDVVFDGKKEKVLALLTKSKDTLIGTQLLSGKLCEFDYKTRKVRIRAGGVLR